MRNKIMLAATTLVLGLTTAGCGAATKQADGKSSTAADDKTPVTFTLFNAAAPGKDGNTDDTTIGKKLEEETGVNFKIEHLVGDINQKIGVMIASGDYPDVLVPDSAVDKVLDAGAFIPLNDLIDKYAPNLKKAYGPVLDRMKQKDGKIYYLPFEAPQGFVPNPNPTGGYYIQRGILKEFGYPKITTLDEYFDLIQKYKAKHPQVDGKETIGFEPLTDDWRFFTLSNEPMHLAGYPNDGGVIVDMNTHKASVYGDKDITKRFLKKMNEVNSQGLFDQEGLVGNYDQYQAKLVSGRVLGTFNYDWQISQANRNLKSAGNDDRRYIALPIVFDKGIKDQYEDPQTFVTNRGIGITTKAKDPVRIIKFFDNLMKEDNQILVNWGVKGETYEVNDKGRFYRTDDEIKKTSDSDFQLKYGFNYFSYYWPMLGNQAVLSNGNAKAPGNQQEVVEKSYTDGDKAILKAYNVKEFSDLFAKPDDRKWYPAWSANDPQGSPSQIFATKSQDLEKKYFPKMILAKPDQFDSLWNEYAAQYDKLDVKAYEDFYNKVIQDRLNGKW